MKTLGVLLIICSFILGIWSENLPANSDLRPFVVFSFIYFLVGIFILIKGDEISRS